MFLVEAMILSKLTEQDKFLIMKLFLKLVKYDLNSYFLIFNR